MQRLIDANELWGQIYKLSHNHKWKDRTNIAFNKCLDAIQFFPTVDAEPVKHGHWEVDEDGNIKCSECGHCGVGDNYCERCGTKMDVFI